MIMTGIIIHHYRLIKVTINSCTESIVSEFTHDATGNVLTYTDPLGDVSNFTYTGRGQLETVESPMGRKAAFEYDGYGNVSKVSEIVGGQEKRNVTMTYDPDTDSLLSITGPSGDTAEFEYDVRGRLTRIIDAYDHTAFSASYDDENRNITVEDGEGKKTHFKRNSSTNFSRIDGFNQTNEYTTNFILDASKTLQSIVYADETRIDFTYDKLLRARESVISSSNASISTLVKRDSIGTPREVSVTYNDGSQREYRNQFLFILPGRYGAYILSPRRMGKPSILTMTALGVSIQLHELQGTSNRHGRPTQ